jgi:hypothetical protein
VTKIKSRYAVAAGGVVLIVLGLCPFLGRVVAAMPTAVLGGAGIVLFGTVTASGPCRPAPGSALRGSTDPAGASPRSATRAHPRPPNGMPAAVTVSDGTFASAGS